MRASVSGGSTSSAPAERVTPPLFERSSDDRVIAGVCGGIGARLAVDPTLVRLVFAILALAGGAGILVYLALWVYARGRRALPAAALFVVASAAILSALGLSGTALLGATLLVAGLAAVLAGAGWLRTRGRCRPARRRRGDLPRPPRRERRVPRSRRGGRRARARRRPLAVAADRIARPAGAAARNGPGG